MEGPGSGSRSGSIDDEVVFEMAQFIRVYKSGRVERYFGSDPVPSSTGVASKDRAISPDVAVRLYLPPAAKKSKDNSDGGKSNKKLPVLVYFHGGGFCLHTAFNFVFHAYLTSLAARARAVVVSVEYRLAPEHPLPAAYEDSWAALRWVASHATAGSGSSDEAWLVDHADFSRLCVGGESAGANIAHHVAMRAATEPLPHGCLISGVAAVHPYFLGAGRVASEVRGHGPRDGRQRGRHVARGVPGHHGRRRPLDQPARGRRAGLEGLACARVLVCLAEKDVVRDRGRAYADALRASGWAGEVDVLEVKGQGHCFHLVDFACDDAVAQDDAIARFVNL